MGPVIINKGTKMVRPREYAVEIMGCGSYGANKDNIQHVYLKMNVDGLIGEKIIEILTNSLADPRPYFQDPAVTDLGAGTQTVTPSPMSKAQAQAEAMEK